MLATLCAARTLPAVHAATLVVAHARPSLLTDMLRGLAAAAPLDMQRFVEAQAALGGEGAGAPGAGAGAAAAAAAAALGSPGAPAACLPSSLPSTTPWGAKSCFREALRELRALSARKTGARGPRAGIVSSGSGSGSGSGSSGSGGGDCGGAQGSAAVAVPASPLASLAAAEAAEAAAAALAPSAPSPQEENSGAQGGAGSALLRDCSSGAGAGPGAGAGAALLPPLPLSIRSPSSTLHSPFSAHKPRSSLGFGRKSLTPNSVGLGGALHYRSSLGSTSANRQRALQPLPLFLAALSMASEGEGGCAMALSSVGSRSVSLGGGASASSAASPGQLLDHQLFVSRHFFSEEGEAGVRASSAPTSLTV